MGTAIEPGRDTRVIDRPLSPSSPSAPWLLREPVLLRFALFLTIACYLPTLRFDFVYDDHFLLAVNPWMESWRWVPVMFHKSFWGFLPIPRITDYYRPLVMLFLAAVRHLLGPAPGWFHLAVAGVHVLATYLTYRLARELLQDGVTAALAAAIFGLHPTKVESAAWISGVSDSLCVVFLLASVIAYLKWKSAGKRGGWLWISLLMLLLALFSKEAAVLAPVLIGIYELSTAEGPGWRRMKIALRCALPFVCVTAAFWTVRWIALRGLAGASGYEVPIGPTIWTAPKVFLWYLGKQLWPGALSVQYPLLLVPQFSVRQFFFPLAIAAAMSLGLWRMVWRRPAGLFLFSWFLLTLAPVVLFAVPLQVHDRYCYLPSVATSIGAAYAIVAFRRDSAALARPRAIVVALLILAMAAATLNYERYWDNDVALFERAVALAPDNPDGYSGLILAHNLVSDTRGARSVAQLWVSRMPRRWNAWYALGVALSDQKDYVEARAAFANALRNARSKKGAVVPLIGLGEVSMALHNEAEAELCYRQAIAIAPNVAALHTYLAMVLQQRGKTAEAQQERALAKSLE